MVVRFNELSIWQALQTRCMNKKTTFRLKRCVKRCMKRCVKRCMNRCIIFVSPGAWIGAWIFFPRCMKGCMNSVWIFSPFFPLSFQLFWVVLNTATEGKKSMHCSCTCSCTWGKKFMHLFMHPFMHEGKSLNSRIHARFHPDFNFQIRKSQSGIHAGFTARDKSFAVSQSRPASR